MFAALDAATVMDNLPRTSKMATASLTGTTSSVPLKLKDATSLSKHGSAKLSQGFASSHMNPTKQSPVSRSMTCKSASASADVTSTCTSRNPGSSLNISMLSLELSTNKLSMPNPPPHFNAKGPDWNEPTGHGGPNVVVLVTVVVAVMVLAVVVVAVVVVVGFMHTISVPLQTATKGSMQPGYSLQSEHPETGVGQGVKGSQE
mmetsp:Transcript_137113/g.341785  ORF Transcript_137113/g.341785 Transcript_137113/m.341785 type:complete len:203 (+) Transcript_137113:589-1197(+)